MNGQGPTPAPERRSAATEQPAAGRQALRAGFQSLPSATVAQLLRRVPPVNSIPNCRTAECASRRGPRRGTRGESRWPTARRSPVTPSCVRWARAGWPRSIWLCIPGCRVATSSRSSPRRSPQIREFRERFNREADLAATLWHPHIVGVHDRGEFNGQLWISMDYVEGTDASRLVKERYPEGMPVHEVSAIMHAVAGALDYAHDRGLLHRDVKPANILLTHPEDGERRILLADFGVARHLGDISGITETNVAVGTVAYAAPEQLTGSNIDGRADQYALAATAFHLLTGAPPFQHSNPIAVISQHLHDGSAPAQRLSSGSGTPRRGVLQGPRQTARGQVRAVPRIFGRRQRAVRRRLPSAVGAVGSVRSAHAGGAGCRGLVARDDPPVFVEDPVGGRAGLRGADRRGGDLVGPVLLPAGQLRRPTPRSRRNRPFPPPAPRRADPAAPVLNGTYQLTYDQSKRTTNGVPIRQDGADSDWWAFRSACTTNGCAATGTQLDDATHQVASTTDGGQTDTLRFVAGYWQGAPQQERVGCTPAQRASQSHPAGDGRVVVGAAGRRHAAWHRDRDRAQQ